MNTLRDVVRDSSARFLLTLLSLLAVTNLVILLNVPLLRPILGFFFFTTVPGMLMLHVLRLNNLTDIDRVLLMVGISVSFILITGLMINTLYPLLGYITPLSRNSLLLSFSIIIVVLAIIAYRRHRAALTGDWGWLKPNTKAIPFLVLPAAFPLLSIAGMLILNETGNNTLLIVLLSLIPAYVVFLTIMHRRVPDGAFPLIVFFIGLSCVLLLGLKSNHVVGRDTYSEYYLLSSTYENLRWQQYVRNSLDSALSISLLPTVYASLLGVNPEYLFKLLYPILFALSPVAIYSIGSRYASSVYAFLSAFFSMTPFSFFWTAALARSSLAVLFFTLCVLVLFRSNVDELSRRVLFLIFSVSVILSHYSTTYVFFWLLFTTWLAGSVILRQRTRELNSTPDPTGYRATRQFHSHTERHASFIKVVLFFALLYFWYQIVTGAAFSSGVGFIRKSFMSLNEVFIMESRAQGVTEAFGQTMAYSEIPVRIKLVFNWLGIISIATGVLGITAGNLKSRFSTDSVRKSVLLPFKIDPEYQVLSLVCCATMVLAVVVPYMAEGYGMDRIYSQVLSVLALFFIAGHMIVAKLIRLKSHWLTLMLVIPLFLSNSGVIDQIFSRPILLLNSKSPGYERFIVHDDESYAAKWLANYGSLKTTPVYTIGEARVLSTQGKIGVIFDIVSPVEQRLRHDSYLYLRYSNVGDGKLLSPMGKVTDIAEWQDILIGKSKIYANGGSEIYR